MAASSGSVGVGIIGAGNISDQYLTNLTRFPDVRVLAVADLIPERARAQAAEYGVPVAGDVDAVLGDPDIEFVVNITPPAEHVGVSLAALDAGKHVWTEKPIGVSREEAARINAKAADLGLRVGAAPDTVLGPGVQTAKRVIARGDIGRPLFAQTTFQWQGPEIFHPDPAFLYAKGGGPLLDMGPYYVSTLVHVFGPVAAVAALGLRGTPTRRVQQGPKAGEEFPVEIPSTLGVLMEFERGGQAQSLYSTDSPMLRHGIVEITGTEGTLTIPDPNTFGGPISITRPLTRLFIPPEPIEQEVVDIAQEGVVSGRGLGLLDMARSIRAGRPHVATGEFGAHVLDALLSIEESAESRGFVTVQSTLNEVGSLDEDFDPYAATL
ncbi:MAG: Gfo/Idh/MocA family oxidoreductase [Microbacterium sp.]|jgi:predicted dehydrogenase|uniref:Gfo/Idh/MocA family protein n=1 Tax=Microbacterium sp. TaxID=51671 RepID=UPI002820236A|nr:Gfo/Idh/MocA family oxidoreductase [Microbacterium sp.]MDR2323703.1 Gfo/Idh/MocA family oxidoreductase [Microbacterium sp.]